MIGPDDLHKKDNHTNIGGFRAERDEFFAWLEETGIAEKGFYIICGDRHWQYHSIDPSGIEEFSTGALIDVNSRLGRKPGDPKSTDPEGPDPTALLPGSALWRLSRGRGVTRNRRRPRSARTHLAG